MLNKPENHVTRGMRERLSHYAVGEFTPPPRIPEAVVAWLELAFPERCYDPNKQTLEMHLLYAGRVGLIRELRGIVEKQKIGESALAALVNDDDPLADDESQTVLDRTKEE